MNVAKSLVAIASMVVAAACGAIPHQVNLPLPSPPTEALTKWKDFPANAKPRPIIAFGDTVEHIPQAGFPTNDRKIAWVCNKLVLASGVDLSSTAPKAATAQGASYPAISAAIAYSNLMASRSSRAASTGCTNVQPFSITAARWASAGFPTDRGTIQMSAWLFDIPEVSAYIGHAALDPSAYWSGEVITNEGRGARLSADGRTLRIAVSNAQPGPCGFDYTAATAESSTAVALAIKQIPHASPGQQVICDLSMRISYMSVTLNGSLSGRVLVDEKGDPGAVCPEIGYC